MGSTGHALMRAEGANRCMGFLGALVCCDSCGPPAQYAGMVRKNMWGQEDALVKCLPQDHRLAVACMLSSPKIALQRSSDEEREALH